MLLNYITHYTPRQQPDSLIFLAPEWGPFAPKGIRNSTSSPFATVCLWPFLVHALSRGRLYGHYPAVRLNFPQTVQTLHPNFLTHYSVNMANALTPRKPEKQLRMLTLPVTCLIAGQDELSDSEAMTKFLHHCNNPLIHIQILADSSHLGCLLDSHQMITDAQNNNERRFIFAQM